MLCGCALFVYQQYRTHMQSTHTRGLVTAAALLTIVGVQFQAAGAEATPVFESLDLGRMSVSSNPAANSLLFPSAP